MKLKELHIRNIASIEQADIDFEQGLTDAATGEPASIFLISGDTGAGKSVILDGISMALYKTTPRLAGVANPQKNTFANDDGESIRVASIEQYTRLGISAADECYSEVAFEGNDGRAYRARLQLGMKKSRSKDAAGNYLLKYNTPKWTLKMDNGDWTQADVEPTIRRAVGLDFQQFGRMAMLAQGQFANFLTGDKAEREAILEQLTNTQHFTAYGEAIYSLYRQAKEAQERVQTQYDTEKPHTLTAEEVEQLEAALRQGEQQIATCEAAIRALDERLKLTEAVAANEKVLTEARQDRQQLEALMAADDYRRSRQLFTDWDATTTQRQQLADLQKAQQEEAQALAALEETQHTFSLLAADMADRQQQLEKARQTIRGIEAWIGERSQHEALFRRAGETRLTITQYLDKEQKAAQLAATLEKEGASTAQLRQAAASARAVAEEAEKAVAQRQEAIDRLNGRRAQLNPQAINDTLKALNSQEQRLADLQNSIANLQSFEEEALRLQASIRAGEETLAQLLGAKEKADADCRSKSLEADKASQRLTTMKMSLDDKIRQLRHRLYEEHTPICPLCGQTIDHVLLDDDFHLVLTPLEQEQRTAAEALRQANERRDKAMGEYKQLSGAHKGRLTQQTELKRKMAALQQDIEAKARQAALSPSDSLAAALAQAERRLKERIGQLHLAQREAESLQQDINRLAEAKKPFDQKLREAEKARTKAESNMADNEKEMQKLEKSLSELAREKDSLKRDISTALAGYCDDWLADTQALLQRLTADADAYAQQQKHLSDALTAKDRAETLMASLAALQQSILQARPEWQMPVEAKAFTCRDISAEWTLLHGRITSLCATVNSSREVMKSAGRELADYYRLTGNTQQTLLALMAQEAQVAAARRKVNDINARYQSRLDAIGQAQRQIEEHLAKLGVARREELPDRQLLEEQKNALGQQRDDVLSAVAQARSRLQTHRENIQRLKTIEAQLLAANQKLARWEQLNAIFGRTRFRTLVQTYILRPLLNNANIYLEQITDRYRLTCSEDNEQLSILVLDRYNKEQVRSVTVLSGGERFMISLALSLALSSLNRPDMNVNILFIDEGFGTLDANSLDSVMRTLEKLQQIAGQSNRRVGIISHREELDERIPVKIQVIKRVEGRSKIEVRNA